MHRVELFERVLEVRDLDVGHARAKVAKRGTVSGLSSKARYRFIRLLAKINRPDSPVFLTLTYRDFSLSAEQWKRDLYRFRHAFTYYYPDLAGVWRLEFQARGAPHYHLLLWLAVAEIDLEALEALCGRLWCRVIGQETAANLEHGARVELVENFRACAFYLSVYQAKDRQDRTDIHTGREWGVWRKERLCMSPVDTVELCDWGVTLLRRVLRRGYRSFCRRSNRKPGRYAQALGRAQNFSSFLPFAESRRLVEWCRGQANDIRVHAERRAEAETGSPSSCELVEV